MSAEIPRDAHQLDHHDLVVQGRARGGVGRSGKGHGPIGHGTDGGALGQGVAVLDGDGIDVLVPNRMFKNVGGKRFLSPGRPLPLRLIVVQLRDDRGRVVAEWLLLSNVPPAWAATTLLAQCYYWRWHIESFFKLLKSHGQQLEQWQQESGPAIARRLLVAAMACVVVWQLQADETPAAVELKNVLVRLSGRQTKRKRPHTAPALLAGLWVLLSMLAMLEHTNLNDLRRLAASIPYLNTG